MWFAPVAIPLRTLARLASGTESAAGASESGANQFRGSVSLRSRLHLAVAASMSRRRRCTEVKAVCRLSYSQGRKTASRSMWTRNPRGGWAQMEPQIQAELREHRLRFRICHEVAHSFFFDRDNELPTAIGIVILALLGFWLLGRLVL